MGSLSILRGRPEGPKRRSDPVIRVETDDGRIITEQTLWEWVGRAVLTHALPLIEINSLRVFLDGVEVQRPTVKDYRGPEE